MSKFENRELQYLLNLFIESLNMAALPVAEDKKAIADFAKRFLS
jgi:hypothetical protein